MNSSTFSTAAMSIIGPCWTPVFGAIADLHRGDGLGQLLDKGVMDARLHVEPVGADTGLAHIAELGDHRAFDGRIEIGIVEDDEGRVAAKLHRDLLHRVGRLLRISVLPISVEPVKVTLRTSGLSMIAPPIWRAPSR